MTKQTMAGTPSQEKHTRVQFIGAGELAKLAGVSRATVYRYVDLGLLEADAQIDKRMLFTKQHVEIIRTIARLRDFPFRFHLNDIRFRVFPEFSWAEIAEMATMPQGRVRQLMISKGL